MKKNILGRIRRKYYNLSLVAIYLLACLLNLYNQPDWPIIIILSLIIISLKIMRSHDIGNNGWWVLIPFYGIALIFFDSEQGINKYGPNPKGNDGKKELDMGKECDHHGNFEEAERYFFMAAKNGNPEAQYEYAMYYRQGKGNTQKNHDIAEYWLKQSAKRGYPNAQNYLKHVEQNNNIDAFSMWEKTAKEMMRNIFFGRGRIRVRDYNLIVVIISILYLIIYRLHPYNQTYWSLILPLLISMISLSLSIMRSHDIGNSGWWVLVPFYGIVLTFFDSEKGINKYGPNPKGDNGEDEFKLATECDYRGDFKEAKRYLFMAAEVGNPKAQYEYAMRCEQGKGEYKKNYDTAEHWFKQSARRGYIKAQNHLGYYYHNGKCVERNYIDAFYWWKQAAKQGDAEAQYNLSVCYKNGDGVEQDEHKAQMWYDRAVKSGYDKEITNEMDNKSILF